MQTLNSQLDDFVGETGEVVPAQKPRSERLERSPELGELFAAMAKAQGAIKTALKTGDNPHFRSKYAKIDAVIEASQAPLAENGLCCMQLPSDLSGRIAVTTWLGHSSGQFIASTLSYPMDRANIQTMGSAITYLSRYSRVAILGIAPEDDDGEAAVGRVAPAADPKPPKHVGAFSKDQPPPEPIPPATGNGQEPALQQKVAAKLQQKRAAALTEMQMTASDRSPAFEGMRGQEAGDDLPPDDDDDSDDADDRVNLGRAQNIMIRQMAKAKIKEGIEPFRAWYVTLNVQQRSVCDRNPPIRAVVAEIKAAQGMRVLHPWWQSLRVYERDTLDKIALTQKAHAADAARS